MIIRAHDDKTRAGTNRLTNRNQPANQPVPAGELYWEQPAKPTGTNRLSDLVAANGAVAVVTP